MTDYEYDDYLIVMEQALSAMDRLLEDIQYGDANKTNTIKGSQ